MIDLKRWAFLFWQLLLKITKRVHSLEIFQSHLSGNNKNSKIMGKISKGLGSVVQSMIKLLIDLEQISTFQWHLHAVFDAQHLSWKIRSSKRINTFQSLDLRLAYPAVLNNRILGSYILQHSYILWMYWNTKRNNWESMTFLGVRKNEEKFARLPD